MDSMSSFPFQQQPSFHSPMASSFLPTSPYQQLTPFVFNGTEGFPLNNLSSMIGQPGYPIDGFPQQWSTQIQSPPCQTRPPPPRSQLSHESPPFIPQQTTPPTVTNKDALKFVPSQVLRNIPKK